eukprot:TRINITY_DN2921_c0_g1_i5.p1 TRINITY_DN2921_c0_g1~~TRINITY_DN2921_c0_g1_i5.p1  ORF type:complete len:148 (-),score=4.10 TRINITY_DN2921_c0_g1_i5:119-562(-)
MDNIVSTTRPVEPTVRSPGPINSRPPGPAILISSDPPPTTQIQRHNVPGSTSVSRSPPLSVTGSNVQQSAQPIVTQTLTNSNQCAQKSPTQVAVTTYTTPLVTSKVQSYSLNPLNPPLNQKSVMAAMDEESFTSLNTISLDRMTFNH